MENRQITYFDTTKKLLQNLENCINKDIDSEFVKEALKTIVSIMQTQNSFLEYVVELDEEMQVVKTDTQIIKGMICFIRGRKQSAKIKEIDEESNIYTLNVLGSDEVIKVAKKHFNI